ncbi:hypothetical protein [Helicobacter saguini]|uniref:hypothetical protein n=1 Tax=Helicobacter saguini TaxID=1548018 RepID=UPI000E5948EA|nr:hypothetical protein [Helicobacter saguini]
MNKFSFGKFILDCIICFGVMTIAIPILFLPIFYTLSFFATMMSIKELGTLLYSGINCNNIMFCVVRCIKIFI